MCKRCQKRRARKNKRLLKTILANQEILMAKVDVLAEENAGIRQNLSEISGHLQSIITRLGGLEEQLAGGLTADQADAAIAEARSIKEALQGVEDIAAAAVNPAPPVE
jgi:hypothetical protein